MHGELRVVPMDGDQLGPIRPRLRLADHRRSLRLQIAEEAVSRELGHEAMGVVDQLDAVRLAIHDVGVGHEERKQNRRVSGQRKPAPLAGRVDHHVEVAGTRAVGEPSGLVPHGVPLILFELDVCVVAVDAARNARQAGDEPGRLQADPHLVTIVLTADRSAVNARSDLDPEDHPGLGDLAGLLGRVRMLEARWEGPASVDLAGLSHDIKP